MCWIYKKKLLLNNYFPLEINLLNTAFCVQSVNNTLIL